MPVQFTRERMEAAVKAHEQWWNGQLDRPLMSITLTGAHPAAGRARAPLLTQATCADTRWSAEELIEALDEALSTQEYLGDGYPRVNLDAFGPGVLAALCGARLDNSSGRVWFFPQREQEIADIHVRYDPDNPWAQRIRALYRAGGERWGGLVAMGMPDLGGVLDVAATLRGTENLLMDLLDEPEEVLRLTGEIEEAWYAAYEDFSAAMHAGIPGGCWSDWSGLLSPVPSYILQCDFSYMIGTDMFRRFVLPTLRRDSERLAHTIYHLDGIGELNHLDAVLSLPKLDAVQWVYGEGKPGPMHWLDVYRRIRAGGKRMMLIGSPRETLEVFAAIGTGGFYCVHALDKRDEQTVRALLDAR